MSAQYWSIDTGRQVIADAAWTYTFPTSALAPIAGLIAFYNDAVSITVDGMTADSTEDLSRSPG